MFRVVRPIGIHSPSAKERLSRSTTAAALALALILPLTTCSDFLGQHAGGGIQIAWRMPIDSRGAESWLGRPGTDSTRAFFEVGGSVVALELTSGRVQWRTTVKQTNAAGAANIVAHNGLVFVSDGEVVALDGGSGAIRWHEPVDSNSSLTQISVDDRAVYVGTRNHRVVALSSADGHKLWSADIGPDWDFFGMATGIATSGDTVYVGAVRYLTEHGSLSAGVIAALDRRTGAILWQLQSMQTRSDISSAPAIADRVLVATDIDAQSFFALDRFTQRELWRITGRPDRFGPVSSPIITDGLVYVGSADGFVYAADVTTGQLRWKQDLTDSVLSLAVCGGTVVAQNLAIAMLDRSSGRLIGEFSGDELGIPQSGVLTVRGLAIVASPGAVYAFRC